MDSGAPSDARYAGLGVARVVNANAILAAQDKIGTLFSILSRMGIMIATRICAALLIALVVGCSKPVTSPSVRPLGVVESHNADVITADELASPNVNSGDALEAVRRLRPRFLATRGSGSIKATDAGSVHVSLDGGPLQGVSFLSRLRPGEIAEIRYLSSSEAAQRFGTSAGTGAVMLIKTR